eukprot:TRINITY_DN9469_c0_g1_i2.p1 TRINITY_DN9469_c0_g1~~TRINITY_DN9469_c0_g1_i2.p1  ORF type:complete len:435 (+),score=76.26 TRINITY_DN9469_c0_g1_i2:92-1396(+)
MAIHFAHLVFGLLVAKAFGNDVYVMSDQGESCATACGLQGRTCVPNVGTNGSLALFERLGIHCQQPNNSSWFAADQPSYVSDTHDRNYGMCLGYSNLPNNSQSCQAVHWSVRRLCRCGMDISNSPFFGTGYSVGQATVNETTRFAHHLAPGTTGVMRHFWMTARGNPDIIIRFYVDNETTPSIEFTPFAAVATFMNDTYAPWGTHWFGVGAGSSTRGGEAFNLNFMIPFSESIRLTIQAINDPTRVFIIARGVANASVEIGGLTLPKTARLKLQKRAVTLQPLEFLDIATVPSGNGLLFMVALGVQSTSWNFIEGCVHAYSPPNEAFPGTLLGTGFEDYYDSGWGFNAGPFYLPNAGCTHRKKSELNRNSSVAAYRFHEQDPVPFNNGFRLQWRNGDMKDPQSGIKCNTWQGGDVVGHPHPSFVQSYVWLYVWD